uniref:Pkinase_fungal domain-containing protein n=1 Tax=Heterorhabditis bacteriophora TaxID=37862 RepID=A0A1I7WPK5_HETBA
MHLDGEFEDCERCKFIVPSGFKSPSEATHNEWLDTTRTTFRKEKAGYAILMTILEQLSIGRVWQEEGERNRDAFRFLNGTDPTLHIPLQFWRPEADKFFEGFLSSFFVVEYLLLQEVVEMLEKVIVDSHSRHKQLGIVMEKNWFYSIDQCWTQTLQFLVYFVDFVGLRFRCGLARIQEVVVDDSTCRAPNTAHDLLSMQLRFGEVFWDFASVHPPHRTSPIVV